MDRFEAIGCNALDAQIYSLHEDGLDCQQIARTLGIGRSEARHRIVKVWQREKERAQCNAKHRASSTR